MHCVIGEKAWLALLHGDCGGCLASIGGPESQRLVAAARTIISHAPPRKKRTCDGCTDDAN